MKRLSTTPISDTAQMPIKKGTLEFLQDAYKECTDSLVKAIVGNSYDPSKAYVLYGCVDSGTGDNHIITAGAIFFNGEVYLVDATTFTTTSPNVPVLTIATTQFYTDADPVIFTDTTSHNVHDIRKIVIASGASGSGIANYADIVKLGSFANTQLAWFGTLTSQIEIVTWFGNPALISSITSPSPGKIHVNHTIGNDRYFVIVQNPIYASGTMYDDFFYTYAIDYSTFSSTSFDILANVGGIPDFPALVQIYTY